MLMVFVPGIGKTGGGALRGVSIFGIRFQPSEIAKVGIIMFFSAGLSKRSGQPAPPKKDGLEAAFARLQEGVLPDLNAGFHVIRLGDNPYQRAAHQRAACGKPAQRDAGGKQHRGRRHHHQHHGRHVVLQGSQKHLFLPEEHNDYIFSIACEELGMVGACVIMALFALLIIRGAA